MSESHVRRIITSQGTKSSTYRTHLHNPHTTENQTHLQTHHVTVLETDPSQGARLIWNHHITENQTNLQRVLTSLRGSLIFKILTLQTNSLISRDSSHHTEAVSFCRVLISLSHHATERQPHLKSPHITEGSSIYQVSTSHRVTSQNLQTTGVSPENPNITVIHHTELSQHKDFSHHRALQASSSKKSSPA